jgi:hypothetical protein
MESDSCKSIDERAQNIQENTLIEMDSISKTKNLNTKMNKDPLHESKIYLSKNDVYDLFKVFK